MPLAIGSDSTAHVLKTQRRLSVSAPAVNRPITAHGRPCSKHSVPDTGERPIIANFAMN